MTNKRRAVALAVGLMALGACGRAPQGSLASLGPGLRLRGEMVDMALVAGRFGWVLLPDRLAVTTDGGLSWRELRPPASGARLSAAAATDAAHAWVAAVAERKVRVDATSDGGRSWETSWLEPSFEPGSVSLGIGDGKVAALVQQVTSSNFSIGELFTTAGGAQWTRREAPVAGMVSIQYGTLWIAGGPGDQELWLSPPGGSWSRAELGGLPQDTYTLQPPAMTSPSRGLVAVTVSRDPHSLVAILGTEDGGRTWTATGKLELQTPTALAAVAIRGDEVVVADPDGNALYRSQDRGATFQKSSPRGLEGVVRIWFTTPDFGWAMADTSRCLSGKRDCLKVVSVLATQDGGGTWRTVAAGSWPA